MKISKVEIKNEDVLSIVLSENNHSIDELKELLLKVSFYVYSQKCIYKNSIPILLINDKITTKYYFNVIFTDKKIANIKYTHCTSEPTYLLFKKGDKVMIKDEYCNEVYKIDRISSDEYGNNYVYFDNQNFVNAIHVQPYK